MRIQKTISRSKNNNLNKQKQTNKGTNGANMAPNLANVDITPTPPLRMT